jgi:hypothetical protein
MFALLSDRKKASQQTIESRLNRKKHISQYTVSLNKQVNPHG